MAILYGCAARCLYGVVFQRSMPSGSVLSQLTNLSRIKEPRTDSPWKRQILKASLLASPRHISMCFWGKFFYSFWFWAIWRALRNLDDYMLCGELEHGLRGTSNQYCMTKHGSSYPQIVYWLRVSGVWNYPIGWAYIKWGRDKRLTWP